MQTQRRKSGKLRWNTGQVREGHYHTCAKSGICSWKDELDFPLFIVSLGGAVTCGTSSSIGWQNCI